MEHGEQVVGSDNCNGYYPLVLKRAQFSQAEMGHDDRGSFVYHQTDCSYVRAFRARLSRT